MGNVKVMNGDILFSHCQTLMLPVSCHGTIQGEAAKRFVRKYPEMVRKYQSLCERSLLKLGLLWIYRSKEHLILTLPVCIGNEPISLEAVRLGLDKLLATYEDKGITSLAMPMLDDGNTSKYGQEVRDLLMTYLERCHIPVELYATYIPQSSKMVPLLEKLCGPLPADKVHELKQKICFECD